MEKDVTLQELVMATADACRDLTVATTSSSQGIPNKLAAAGLAGRRPNHWQNSEVVFIEPDAGLNGRLYNSPFVVTGYTDGLFTLDHPFGNTGAPQGLDFFIVRNHGQGNPYRAYLRAIKRALDNLGVAKQVDSYGLTTSAGVYTFTVPTELDTIFAVLIQSGDVGPFELRPDQWSLYPDRGLRFSSDVNVTYGWEVILRGRKFGDLPLALNGTVYCDAEDVVDEASEYLFRTDNKQVSQVKGQSLQAERIKFKAIAAYPNEQRILP